MTTAPAQAPGRRTLVVALIGAAGLAVAALAISALSPRPQVMKPGSAPTPAHPPVTAPPLMEGLTTATNFGDAKVIGWRLLEEGVFRVELEVGGAHVGVDVARLDPAGPPPVASTKSLGLYFAHTDGAPSEAAKQAVTAMAEVLAKAEAGGAAVPTLKSIAEMQQVGPPREARATLPQ